jgi:hypothetical protein
LLHRGGRPGREQAECDVVVGPEERQEEAHGGAFLRDLGRGTAELALGFVEQRRTEGRLVPLDEIPGRAARGAF